MALLVERQVTLEMCPISNYQTGCVDDLAEHRARNVEIDAPGPAAHGTADGARHRDADVLGMQHAIGRLAQRLRDGQLVHLLVVALRKVDDLALRRPVRLDDCQLETGKPCTGDEIGQPETDRVEVLETVGFESELLEYMKGRHGDLMRHVDETGAMPDEETLAAAIAEGPDDPAVEAAIGRFTAAAEDPLEHIQLDAGAYHGAVALYAWLIRGDDLGQSHRRCDDLALVIVLGYFTLGLTEKPDAQSDCQHRPQQYTANDPVGPYPPHRGRTRGYMISITKGPFGQRPFLSAARPSITPFCASPIAASGVDAPLTILFIAVVTGDHIRVISA